MDDRGAKDDRDDNDDKGDNDDKDELDDRDAWDANVGVHCYVPEASELFVE